MYFHLHVTMPNNIISPCHLVLSTRRVLATIFTSLLQCFLSVVTSLSSASFIPVTSCISSIHFLPGRPLLLLPSLCASIIFFPNHLIAVQRILTSFLVLFVVAFLLLLFQSPCVHFHLGMLIEIRQTRIRFENRNPVLQIRQAKFKLLFFKFLLRKLHKVTKCQIKLIHTFVQSSLFTKVFVKQ